MSKCLGVDHQYYAIVSALKSYMTPFGATMRRHRGCSMLPCLSKEAAVIGVNDFNTLLVSGTGLHALLSLKICSNCNHKTWWSVDSLHSML